MFYKIKFVLKETKYKSCTQLLGTYFTKLSDVKKWKKTRVNKF